MDLLDFQFSQYGPNLFIEVASVPAEHAARCMARPASQRRADAGFYFKRIGPMLGIDFEGAAVPGRATTLADSVLRTISMEGEPWWLNPSPAVVLPNPSLERP
jgi:hypothetical protein